MHQKKLDGGNMRGALEEETFLQKKKNGRKTKHTNKHTSNRYTSYS
jgi:hypothetical protein